MPSPIGFKLENIEPGLDPAYALSRQAQAAFWHQAGLVGLRIKRLSLARGLDKNGLPMAPIHALTRQARRDDINSVTGKHPYSPRGRARESAPPLQATGSASRTYGLLRFDVAGEGVWFSWGFDASTGLDWGIVLARHARGFTQRFTYPQPGWGHVPSRDVIGLSHADIQQISHEMRLWWGSNRNRWAPKGEGASEGQRRAVPATQTTGRYFERGPAGPTLFTAHTGESGIVPGEELHRLRGRGDLFTKQVPRNLKPPPSSPVINPAPAPVPPTLAAKVKPARQRQTVLMRSLMAPAPPPPPAAPMPPMTPAAAAKFFMPKLRTFGLSTAALRWIAAAIGLGIAAAIASTRSIASGDSE